MKVTDLVEKADRASFKGNHKRALSLYQDALFILQHDAPDPESDAIVHLQEEIGKMRRLSIDS
jgi:hypothetical protein